MCSFENEELSLPAVHFLHARILWLPQGASFKNEEDERLSATKSVSLRIILTDHVYVEVCKVSRQNLVIGRTVCHTQQTNQIRYFATLAVRHYIAG